MNPNPLEEQSTLTKEEYLQNSFANPPSLSHSVWNNFAAGWTEPWSGAKTLADTLQEDPEENRMRTFMKSIEIENEVEGQRRPQNFANWSASMIGFTLNPISIVTGELGAAALRLLAPLAAKFAPSALTAFMRSPLVDKLGDTLGGLLPEKVLEHGVKKTLSAALLGEKALVAFGAGAGAGFAPAIEEHYNKNTNSIGWGGVAKSMTQSGGMGLAIGSVGYSLGMVRGKFREGKSKGKLSDVTTNELKEAVKEGKITPEEANFYHDAMNHLKDADELKASASQIILKNGHNVDIAANEVPVNILKPEDIDSLMTATNEQLITDAPQELRSALSDFITHNSIDELRMNPKQTEGLRGYSDFIAQKLEHRDTELKLLDHLIEKEIEKPIKENAPFSQKHLFEKARELNLTGKELDAMPFTVPENIKNSFAHEKKLTTLSNKQVRLKEQLKHFKGGFKKELEQKTKKNSLRLERYQKELATAEPETHKSLARSIKQLQEKNKQLKSRIDKGHPERVENIELSLKELSVELRKTKKNAPKLLAPHQEIKQLKEKIITSDGIMKDFEHSKEYHRLLDLMEALPQKKELFKNILMRIFTDNEYKKQEAFKSLVDHIISVSDSNAPRFANIENVIRYAKSRVQEPLKKSVSMESRPEAKEILQDREAIFSEQKEQASEINAGDLSEELRVADEKLTEFKSKGAIFNNLISCILGASNGQAE